MIIFKRVFKYFKMVNTSYKNNTNSMEEYKYMEEIQEKIYQLEIKKCELEKKKYALAVTLKIIYICKKQADKHGYIIYICDKLNNNYYYYKKQCPQSGFFVIHDFVTEYDIFEKALESKKGLCDIVYKGNNNKVIILRKVVTWNGTIQVIRNEDRQEYEDKLKNLSIEIENIIHENIIHETNYFEII